MNPNATLLVEPDPELANLSWVVLPTYAGPLGLAYPLSDSQSILGAAGNSNGQNLTVSRTRNAARPLVIGVSIASGNEPPLPEALEEAQSVSRFLKSPQVLLGKDATRAQMESRLGTAAVLHFAGHAVQSPTGTELLLAAQPNNAKPWIDGAFLRQHPPRACRLAVLSACATGQREAAWNHPVQDIVETLGSLGVPDVVATHWQVDSEAAVPLMNAFYQNLARGSSVAMALTSARRVLSSQVQYNNPYYWGSYYATGLGTANSRGSLRASLQKHP
jgi:CHAT domain-containing protein